MSAERMPGVRMPRVVVTGAAGGIGRAVAHALAADGARLALLDQAGAADVLAELPAHARGIALDADVRDEAATGHAVARAIDALGGLDRLVHCAGVSGPVGTPIGETSLEDWRLVFDVNVTGAFLVVRAALPALREGRDPAIVVLGSDSAFVASGGMVPYGASKAALVQFVRALAVELTDDGIRVNAVCPSIVDTPMSRGDLGRPGGFDDADYPVQTPAQVAEQVRFLASPASAPVNGHALVSDFAFSARSGFPA